MAIMHDLFGLLNVPHCHYEFLALFVDTEILTAPVSVRKKKKGKSMDIRMCSN